MSNENKRFVVSDLGFAWAVHDTQVPQDYAFRAGKDKEHASTNRLNSRRVDVFPTFAEAARCADELNRGAKAG